MATCPNCGSDLASSIETVDGEKVSPEGGIQVCTGCNIAVDPNADNPEVSPDQPPPEASPRGVPGPDRVEDQPGYETGQVDATDAAVELAEEKGINLADVEGTGAEGRITKEDVEGAT